MHVQRAETVLSFLHFKAPAFFFASHRGLRWSQLRLCEVGAEATAAKTQPRVVTGLGQNPPPRTLLKEPHRRAIGRPVGAKGLGFLGLGAGQ